MDSTIITISIDAGNSSSSSSSSNSSSNRVKRKVDTTVCVEGTKYWIEGKELEKGVVEEEEEEGEEEFARNAGVARDRRDLDYAGNSRIAKILPVHKKATTSTTQHSIVINITITTTTTTTVEAAEAAEAETSGYS
ncbi:hypothetical protein M0802_003853 [Mischocyttarus mexicanus]|nr:hypothetical protein M0802_003853 [Mischocyttarus mexicanus]